MHGRILQHRRSTALSMCLHFPHLHHGKAPCGGWDSSPLVLLWRRHFASSTPPRSCNNSTSNCSCCALPRDWTNAWRACRVRKIENSSNTNLYFFPVRTERFLQIRSTLATFYRSILARTRRRFTLAMVGAVLPLSFAWASICSLARGFALTTLQPPVHYTRVIMIVKYKPGFHPRSH